MGHLDCRASACCASRISRFITLPCIRRRLISRSNSIRKLAVRLARLHAVIDAYVQQAVPRVVIRGACALYSVPLRFAIIKCNSRNL
jgi:hypothetical protein